MLRKKHRNLPWSRENVRVQGFIHLFDCSFISIQVSFLQSVLRYLIYQFRRERSFQENVEFSVSSWILLNQSSVKILKKQDWTLTILTKITFQALSGCFLFLKVWKILLIFSLKNVTSVVHQEMYNVSDMLPKIYD